MAQPRQGLTRPSPTSATKSSAEGTPCWAPGRKEPRCRKENAIEFSALVKIGGMTPAQALQAGTSNAAKLMRWGGDLGSISKGKFADIIAVSGDPLADISETERVKFVMKSGEVFRNDLTPGTRGSEFITR